MEKRYRRFTRLLVSLPPIQEMIDEVSREVEKAFKRQGYLPEYVKTPDIEGFAISWLSWYGYIPLNSGEAARLRGFFGTRFVDITGIDIEDSLIEYVDEDNWWYIDNQEEINHEVFNFRYEKGEDTISVYKNFFRLNLKGRIADIEYSEFNPNLIYNSEVIVTLKEPFLRICRRGFFNGVRWSERLYEMIGLTKIPKP